MGSLVGIDVRATHVRAVRLKTRYRKVIVERMTEIDRSAVPDLEAALRAAAEPLAGHGEPIAVCVEGESAFVNRIRVPSTAAKQLSEVLPFELEGQLPVDISEVVWDYRVLPSVESGTLQVLTAAARTDTVRAELARIQQVFGREPERIGCGALPLAELSTLSPQLAAEAPRAIVDLAGSRTEVVVLAGGEARFARTLSRGVAGLPDSAPALAADLRQTFVAWMKMGGEPIQHVYLVGGGAAAPGAEAYLAAELGVPVDPLPELELEELADDQRERLPRFAKAIALAHTLAGRGRSLNLRQGELAYERGFEFLKEKVPLLSGLAAAIAISFAFSTWAEWRELDRRGAVASDALAKLSKNVLGEETTDPDQVKELINGGPTKKDSDPMPRIDAFDVIVEISKAVPMDVVHDIEEFDMAREHVKINAVVGTTEEAQKIASAMKKNECFDDVKISKISQVVKSTRQKYVLEFDVDCPDPTKAKKKKKTESGDEGGEE